MNVLTPDQVATHKEAAELEKAQKLPDGVVKAFNNLIVKNWSDEDNCAQITQGEAVSEVMVCTGVEREEVFNQHMLDVEPLYRANGWNVKFHKTPYYISNDDSFFVFTKKT